MSKAELKAQYLFDTLGMENVDDEVRRHLIVLMLTVPYQTTVKKSVPNNKQKALERLAGCVTLPDDFDYKTSLGEALESKYM